jgi:hypothetical protein
MHFLPKDGLLLPRLRVLPVVCGIPQHDGLEIQVALEATQKFRSDEAPLTELHRRMALGGDHRGAKTAISRRVRLNGTTITVIRG